MIPQVSEVVDFQTAVKDAEGLDMLLVPYEEARGMERVQKNFETREEKSIHRNYDRTGRRI